MSGQLFGRASARIGTGPVRGRGRRRTSLLTLCGLVLAGTTVLVQPAGATPPAAPAAAPTESERAAELGHRVEVVSARDEYSTTYANPDGTFLLDQAVSPVRVRGTDGAWHEPDATLVRRDDGTVGPRHAAVDMAFSAGGSGAMVRLRDGARSVTLDFPGSLPDPVLSGSDATYPEVFPGVDLKVTASTTGFRQVLVVKSRAAARNPALRGLTFPVRAVGLTVRGSDSGAFEAADANGVAVFSGPAGMMWDSAPTPVAQAALNPIAGAAAAAQSDGEADSSRAHGPSARSRVANLRTKVSSRALTVTPDAAWLDDPRTSYPVYIDPPIGATEGGYTVFRSDGWKDWMFPDDEGVGKCGSLTISGVTYVCGSGYVQRQAYKFTNSNLGGKYVTKAVFRIKETWSFTCTASVTNLYRLSSGISSSTSWPGPSTVDLVADENFSAGRGTACSPEQPDRDIEFADDSGDTADNLTSTVRSLANGTWSSVSFLLRNASETDTGDWKRFNGSTATLQVTYVPKPGVPTTTGVRASSTTTTSCSTNSAAPTTVTKLTPTLAATLQTEKAPASGEEKGYLAGQFQVFTVSSSTATWDSGVATSGWQPDNYVRTVAVPSGKLVEGTTYRLRVRTQSHYTGGDLFSSYSGWCYFRPVLHAPLESTITADTNPANGVSYPLCAPDCTPAGGPGLTGRFKVTNPMNTVTSFKWSLIQSGLDGAPGKVVSQGTATASSVGGLMTGYVLPTPQLDGVHELSVTAVNAAGDGEPTSVFLAVAPGAAPVGEWKVEDPSAPLADSSGGGHDLTLQTGTSASTLGRSAANVAGDGSLAFANAGGAVTSAPVLDTSGSFTVSAWAYLQSRGSAAHIVASQATASPLKGFQLFYSGANDRWKFGVTGVQADGTSVGVQSMAAAVPVVGAWTHLTGVYDAVGKTVELFVNGVSQGKVAVAVQPGATAGALMIGRDEMGASPEPFDGNIDQVRVWNRLLTATEVDREAQSYAADGSSAAALVGFWQPSTPDASLADASGYGRGALAPTGGATAVADEGLVLNGTTAGATTAGGLVDENTSFTVSAKVHGMTTKTGKGRLVSQKGASTGLTWSLYYDYATTQWKFERTGLNAAGATVTAVASSTPIPVDAGEVVVTGVYDADSGTVEVIVTLAPQCNGACTQQTFASGQGTGELSVGMSRTGTNSATVDALTGTVDWVRVWAGAMTPNNLAGVIFS